MALRSSRTLNAQPRPDHIGRWMTDYIDRSGLEGWVVGVSGGIDSAVTSTLAARTGRPTTVLRMPIHQAADQDQRGADHIAWLESEFDNVSSLVVDLTPSFDGLSDALAAASGAPFGGLSLANARARLRMTTLYAVAAERRALVAGTGNKVEDFGVGFYTKYGDGGVDLSPIADLLKNEVYALGRALGVGEAILNAAPTDGLWGDDRTDEDQAQRPTMEPRMGHGTGGRRAHGLRIRLGLPRGGGAGDLPPPPPGQPAQDGPHPGLRDPGFFVQLSLTPPRGWPNPVGRSCRRRGRTPRCKRARVEVPVFIDLLGHEFEGLPPAAGRLEFGLHHGGAGAVLGLEIARPAFRQECAHADFRLPGVAPSIAALAPSFAPFQLFRARRTEGS